MKHYTYKLIDAVTGEFYFGSRSHEEPENDNYMGSMVTWKPEDKSRLIKEIIKDDFETREDAIEYESELISETIDDNLNRNYYIPSKGFHTFGIPGYWKGKSKPFFYGDKNPAKRSDVRLKISEGLRGRHMSTLTRDKIRNSLLGFKHTNETKKTLSKLQTGKNNPFYGKSHSNKSLKQMSETTSGMYGGDKNPNASPVLQYDIEGNFIKKWSCIKYAYEELGIHNISAVCRGLQKSAGGYIWKYDI